MPSCYVYGCGHSRARGYDCRFHCFPSDKREFERWLKFAKRPVCTQKLPKACSCHFKDGKKENGPTLFKVHKLCYPALRKKLETEEGRSEMWDNARWSDREMFDFAKSLQRHGFADTKQITEDVKTKSEDGVKALIEQEVRIRRRQMFNCVGWNTRKNFSYKCLTEGKMEGWSDLQKWLKVVQRQQGYNANRTDYSCMLIPSIWEKFHSEASPPTNPQQLDVRSIYKFISQCMRGVLPPELPPKESATLLSIMHIVREMLSEMDMEEEMHFAHNFKKATPFVPFFVKGERKWEKKDKPPTPGDAISIPFKLHLHHFRHRRVVQSFNALTVPPWLIEKEQKMLHCMFQD